MLRAGSGGRKGGTWKKPNSWNLVCLCVLCVWGKLEGTRSALQSVVPTLAMSQLEQLRKLTTVVADSGDFNSYSALKGSIQDGTTNPSVRSQSQVTDSCTLACYTLIN